MTDPLAATLRQGCDALGIDLTDNQQQQLLRYVGLLDKWNKVYNLTSIRDPQQMVARHLIDSLAILPYLNGESLLDVGTGAGLPGIPVAIMRPQLSVTLLDSNSKKTRFLQQVKVELGLDNVEVVHGRVEQVSLPKFAIVTARAFATIDTIIALAGTHCDETGSLILMKGVYPQQELEAELTGFQLRDVVALDVPGCDGQRHLVRLDKT